MTQDAHSLSVTSKCASKQYPAWRLLCVPLYSDLWFVHLLDVNEKLSDSWARLERIPLHTSSLIRLFDWLKKMRPKRRPWILVSWHRIWPHVDSFKKFSAAELRRFSKLPFYFLLSKMTLLNNSNNTSVHFCQNGSRYISSGIECHDCLLIPHLLLFSSSVSTWCFWCWTWCQDFPMSQFITGPKYFDYLLMHVRVTGFSFQVWKNRIWIIYEYEISKSASVR